MARKRMLEPSIWDDRDVRSCSRDERLLFIAMVSMADDYGHITGDPAQLRKFAFGYDDDILTGDVETMRDHLVEKCRNVLLYIVDGQEYIWLRKWEEHQDLRFRAKGLYPCHHCGKLHTAKDFEGCQDAPIANEYLPDGIARNSRTSCVDIAHISSPDYVELRRDTSSQDTLSKHVASAPAEPDFPFDPIPKDVLKPTNPPKSEYSEAFEAFWSIYPRPEEKRGAFKAWNARLKGGAKPDDLLAAARNYATAHQQSGAELQFVKLPSTFLGPDRDYEDWISGIPPGRISNNSKKGVPNVPANIRPPSPREKRVIKPLTVDEFNQQFPGRPARVSDLQGGRLAGDP